MKYKIIIFLLLISLLILAGCSVNANHGSNNNTDNEKVKVKIFKSSSCGCCDAYSKYMDSKGYDVEIINVDPTKLSEIKNQYGVPSELQSCHTMIVGNYFVEGHVPLEAVEKMMQEKPDIKGIGISGMPSGAPGMPGSKSEVWTIQAVNMDDSLSEFMTI